MATTEAKISAQIPYFAMRVSLSDESRATVSTQTTGMIFMKCRPPQNIPISSSFSIAGGIRTPAAANPCEETDFPVVVPEQERNGKDAGGNDRQMIQKRLEDEYPSGISEQIVEAAEQA